MILLPRLPWSGDYSTSSFQKDLIAGITTAVMLIPQSMAYALLAGLPIQVGLYAATIPLFVYAFWGSARSLAVGPVALDSLLSASAIGALALSVPTLSDLDKITAAAMLAVMVGFVLLLMGIFRLGSLVSLLTPTIISAFTSAAALIIAINQLKLILRVDLVRSSNILEILVDLGHKIESAHILTFIIAFIAIVLITILKRWAPKVPRAFTVVLLGIGLVYLLDLGSKDVELIGTVPSGLPSFFSPWLGWTVFWSLLPHAVLIAMIAFMEAISISTKLKREGDNIEPSRELVALGLSNVSAGLFQGYSVSGGLSRTAVNDSAGAMSQVASLITGMLVVLTIGIFSTILASIPKAILGAIILTAAFGLISIKDFRKIVEQHRDQIPTYLCTFFITLLVGIKEGLILGVCLNWLLTRVRSK